MPTINSRVEMQFDDYAYSGTVTSQNFDTMSFGVVLDWEEEKWPEVKLGKHLEASARRKWADVWYRVAGQRL